MTDSEHPGNATPDPGPDAGALVTPDAGDLIIAGAADPNPTEVTDPADPSWVAPAAGVHPIDQGDDVAGGGA